MTDDRGQGPGPRIHEEAEVGSVLVQEPRQGRCPRPLLQRGEVDGDVRAGDVKVVLEEFLLLEPCPVGGLGLEGQALRRDAQNDEPDGEREDRADDADVGMEASHGIVPPLRSPESLRSSRPGMWTKKGAAVQVRRRRPSRFVQWQNPVISLGFAAVAVPNPLGPWASTYSTK